MTRRRSILPSEEGNDINIEPTFGRNEDEITLELTNAEIAFEEPAGADWDEEEIPASPRGTWIVPALAIAAVLGWTGFFGWVHHQEILAGASAQQWSQWISTWSVPVLLVIGLWLLAMRNSRREANRFTDAARALAYESGQLETRLTIVNRELSLARDFIASQSRDLESLGRVATERLSTNAARLQELISDNGAQVETLGSVSTSALANMESLRDQLPVLSNAARDMSNQIGNAGNVAHGQIEALVSGFDRLNQFGEAGEKHVETISAKVTATLDAFDMQIAALGEVTQARFGKLRDVSEAFRTDMVESEDAALESIRVRADEMAGLLAERETEQREAEDAALAALRNQIATLTGEGERLLGALADGREHAVSAWSEAVSALETRMAEAIAEVAQTDEQAMESARRRLAALSEEAAQVEMRISASLVSFDSELQHRRESAARMQTEALDDMESRLTTYDAKLARRQDDYLALLNSLGERSEELAARINRIDSDLRRLAQDGEDTTGSLDTAAESFAARLTQSRELLDENTAHIARLTDDGVRLLEIIRSGADHSQGALSDAVGEAEARLARFGEEASRLHDLVTQAEARGESLASHIGSAQQSGASTLADMQALEAHIGLVAAESAKLADHTSGQLREAIDLLAGSSTHAIESLRDNHREVVEEIANRIAEDSRIRVAEAIQHHTTASIEELEEAVSQAAARGRETTVDLRDQLALVNELTGNLEQRITTARERAEEKIDSDFSRRMALITESLNSSAIDIAKAFDTEVSDTQWANYLRGDRGIFTRRAVRLLSRHDSRNVAEVYGEDSEFRETVNRFIHDFEAMLREVLSTRDGNALAVTLLSSDTGKLYVALAQAIERLRN
ncbi:hypothetical protein [Aurantiacibacter marinus]|uniref:hypothetical protein n=1 Tax=Aurantiacibacter marinus TaxID=874156 RepID=UPI00069B086E|nr:hypothetical protein [Aurantiacibacter marinus]